MDLNAIGAFFVQYILQQWPFFFVAFLLGVAGQVFKQRVFTLKRAQKSKFFWWARALLPFHAPIIGFIIGVVFWSIFKEDTPTGPGIRGGGAVLLYYTGAGAASSWLFGAVKHVLESRFGVKTPTELDDYDSLRPPDPPIQDRPTPVTVPSNPPPPDAV